METDAQVIRSQLFAVLREFQGQRPGSRLALVQFRDYMEDFLYKVTPFGNDPEIIGAQLADYAPAEGRDIPEALYEGVHACLTELDWAAEGRRIILLGDGPPHPMPRGSVSADMVIRGLRDKAVVLDALLLPE
jgi:hypothetical protein